MGYLPEWGVWEILAAEGLGTFLILSVGLLFTFGPILGCLHALAVPRDEWNQARGGRGAWIALLLFGLVLTVLSLVPFIVYYLVIARHVTPPFKPLLKAFAPRVLVGALIWALPATIWLARRPDVFTWYLITVSFVVAIIAGAGVALDRRRRPAGTRDTRIAPALLLLLFVLIVSAVVRTAIIAACEQATAAETWCEGAARARTRSMVPVFLTAAGVTIALVAVRKGNLQTPPVYPRRHD